MGYQGVQRERQRERQREGKGEKSASCSRQKFLNNYIFKSDLPGSSNRRKSFSWILCTTTYQTIYIWNPPIGSYQVCYQVGMCSEDETRMFLGFKS